MYICTRVSRRISGYQTRNEHSETADVQRMEHGEREDRRLRPYNASHVYTTE